MKPIWTALAVSTSILLVAGVVVAAAILGTQTVPAIGAKAAMTFNCATLTDETGTPTTGSSGTFLLDCGGNPTTAGFVVTQAGTATPTFTPPTGITGVTILAHVAGATTCSGGTSITSGTSASLTAGSFDYCITYATWPSGGTTSFTFTWA